ncbi:hypothetical protein ABZT06_44395 [Streptomyces sp. NPDC005483]|uniref:hypothetical protein n=1 Tax=Streptomyces sp. NPDC005483 TaxID=3154882 RepID=UPI0033B873BA
MVVPDLSAVPAWGVLLTGVLTTVASTLIALVRLVLHALPQNSADRLEWWKTFLAYRLDRRRVQRAEQLHEQESRSDTAPVPERSEGTGTT